MYNQSWVQPVRGTTSHHSGVQPATSQGYNQPLVKGTTNHQSGVQPVRGTTSHQSGVQPATSQGYNQPLVRSTTSQGYNNLIKLGAYSGLGPWINQARGRRGNVCTCSPLSTYSHLRQSLLPIMWGSKIVSFTFLTKNMQQQDRYCSSLTFFPTLHSIFVFQTLPSGWRMKSNWQRNF